MRVLYDTDSYKTSHEITSQSLTLLDKATNKVDSQLPSFRVYKRFHLFSGGIHVAFVLLYFNGY